MKKRRKKIVCSLLSSTLLLGSASVALAEEIEQTFALDEMVITASRMPTKLAETAANVTVVSREEMDRKNLKSVTEALVQAGAQVEVEGGGGAISRIMLNGSTQVIVLVDGRRVGWEQQAGMTKNSIDANTLPNLDSVERIEVVRGAASSLYGSAGVGGVVNIITRQGEEKLTTASSEFGSWNSRRYSLQTGGKENDTGYMVTAERWKQGNFEYKDPATGDVNTMPNSGFTRDKASVRIDKDLGKDRALTFYFDHLNEDINTPMAKPGMYYPKFNPNTGNYDFYSLHRSNAFRRSIQNNVALAYRWKQGEDINNNFQIYRNHYNRHWSGYKPDGSSASQYNEADGIEWNQTRRLSDHHTLLGGFDWRKAHIDIPEYDFPNKKLRTLGVFLEDHWNFDRDWTLNTGFRWDDADIYGDESTARISLNRKVKDNTNIYLSWGQVYRGPDLDMLYMPTIDYFKGNPNLKPEKGHTTALGVNTKLAGGTSIQASLFSSYLKDAISWKWDNNLSVYEAMNINKQKKRGLDLAVTHPLNSLWDLTAGYSYVRAREAGQDGVYNTDVSNSNPNSYRLGLAYHKDAWNVNLLGRGATGRSLDAFTSKRYWVLDVGASYQMNPDVKIYAKAYNLTNRAYEIIHTDYGLGAEPMPSRQIVIGVEGRL